MKIIVSIGNCRLPDSPIRGVVFRRRISPRIQSQNRNGSKCSARDLGQSDLCKKLGKFGSLPCLFSKVPGVLRLLSKFANSRRDSSAVRSPKEIFCYVSHKEPIYAKYSSVSFLWHVLEVGHFHKYETCVWTWLL